MKPHLHVEVCAALLQPVDFFKHRKVHSKPGEGEPILIKQQRKYLVAPEPIKVRILFILESFFSLFPFHLDLNSWKKKISTIVQTKQHFASVLAQSKKKQKNGNLTSAEDENFYFHHLFFPPDREKNHLNLGRCCRKVLTISSAVAVALPSQV